MLQDRVQAAAAYMRARPSGGLFVLCLDNVSGAAKEALSTILTQAKFVQAIPMTGMAGDILPMAAPGHPALRFKRILDEATIQDFAELNCVSYGVPVETGRSLVKEHALWHEHAYGFVGYAGDKAVSTATAIISESRLFLFLVATMPEARCKGYGEAVVRLALQTAYEATGIRRTVLHATEAGYPLYLRLGYQPTAKFRMHARVVSPKPRRAGNQPSKQMFKANSLKEDRGPNRRRGISWVSLEPRVTA